MVRAAPVTVLILLLCVVVAQGIPIPGTQGRCQCLRVSSVVIHPKLIKSLNYIPRGSHCEDVEIIISLKSKETVCLDPEAKWVEVLITSLKGVKNKQSKNKAGI
ncbi:alveolar macrophage chemotactic factor-like [Narcine bancroftii]|uniref:alveolar macrophage chemotactic factor-like n=1 Tax=Narcine bancroftii TaxID=1343680 RepID=UPI0038317909